jgi:hypothetical protein
MSSNTGIIIASVIGVISIAALGYYATNKSLKNDTNLDNKEDTNRYSLSSLDDEKNEDRETIYSNPYHGYSEDNPANFNFSSDSDDEQEGGNNKSKKNKSKKNKSKKNKSKKNKSKKNKSKKNKFKKTNK